MCIAWQCHAWLGSAYVTWVRGIACWCTCRRHLACHAMAVTVSLTADTFSAATLQDLAKAKLWQKQAAGKQDFAAPPIQLDRSLNDPNSCTLQQWAPPGGPVRPLLQVNIVTCVAAPECCSVAVTVS
jgi:hypothetical protein